MLDLPPSDRSNSYIVNWIKVVVFKGGKEWSSDAVQTTGAPAQLILQSDRTTIARDGRDLAFVTVIVADGAGRRVPVASNLVHFSVNVPGTLVAVANGDPTDLDAFHADRYRAFHGQCLAIVRSPKGSAGKTVLTAESDGLSPGSVSIETR